MADMDVSVGQVVQALVQVFEGLRLGSFSKPRQRGANEKFVIIEVSGEHQRLQMLFYRIGARAYLAGVRVRFRPVARLEREESFQVLDEELEMMLQGSIVQTVDSAIRRQFVFDFAHDGLRMEA